MVAHAAPVDDRRPTPSVTWERTVTVRIHPCREPHHSQGDTARRCACLPIPALLGAVPALDPAIQSAVVQAAVGVAIGAAIGIGAGLVILALQLRRFRWRGADATFEPLQLPKPKKKPRTPRKPGPPGGSG